MDSSDYPWNHIVTCGILFRCNMFTDVSTYVCMHVCMHVCMYAHIIYACMDVWFHICNYIDKHTR